MDLFTTHRLNYMGRFVCLDICNCFLIFGIIMCMLRRYSDTKYRRRICVLETVTLHLPLLFVLNKG